MRPIDADALLEQIEVDSIGKEGQYGDEWLFLETIEKAPTIDRPSSEWIPCSERLPEMCENVLLYIPLREGVRQHGIRIGYRDEDNPIPEDEDGKHNFWGMKTYGGKWHVTGWGYYDEPIPIAWMPLPAIWEEGESNG